MLTKEQRELRKNHVGSSDVAAIMNLSRWKTAHDVWLEKTNRLEDSGADEETPLAAEAGNFFESAVLDWGEQSHLGKLIRTAEALECRHETLPMVSHPDAIVAESQQPVEAKTAGLFTPLSSEWGDPGTDNIPTGYIIQAHVHIMCMKASSCYLPAFLGGRGFEMYYVAKNPDLVEVIGEKVAFFWDHNVKGDTPPEGILPSLEFIKRIRRIPGKCVKVPEQSITEWLEAKAIRKAAEEDEDAKRLVILALLEDSEGSDPTTLGQLTYFMQGRTTIDTERLKSEKPDIYNAYLKTSKFRVLRLRKGATK